MSPTITAADGSVSYYIEKWTDEVLPCGTSLQEWAEWLSKPDKEWGRHAPAQDGEIFAASRIRWAEDIVATRAGDGSWSYSRKPEGEPSVIAVRFAQGLGWSPENIVPDFDELEPFLADPDNGAEDEEFVAVGYSEPDVVLCYRADPPRLIVQGTQQ